MDQMTLLAISVGRPKEVTYQDRRGREKATATGIFKQPVTNRAMLRATNLDGDGQADLIGHGGADKAAYVYSRENYDYWAKELDRTDLPLPANSAKTSLLKG